MNVPAVRNVDEVSRRIVRREDHRPRRIGHSRANMSMNNVPTRPSKRRISDRQTADHHVVPVAAVHLVAELCSRRAPGRRTSCMWMPVSAPPLMKSSPEPPRNVSLPVSPRMKSRFGPPSIVSLPAWPKRRSSPVLPSIVVVAVLAEYGVGAVVALDGVVARAAEDEVVVRCRRRSCRCRRRRTDRRHPRRRGSYRRRRCRGR